MNLQSRVFETEGLVFQLKAAVMQTFSTSKQLWTEAGGVSRTPMPRVGKTRGQEVMWKQSSVRSRLVKKKKGAEPPRAEIQHVCRTHCKAHKSSFQRLTAGCCRRGLEVK